MMRDCPESYRPPKGLIGVVVGLIDDVNQGWPLIGSHGKVAMTRRAVGVEGGFTAREIGRRRPRVE
jgi:hypothetical protein